MKERFLKKSGGDGIRPLSWWRRKLWWLVACGAVSIVPLILEMIYLLITGQQFSLIVSRPSIPAIAVIWCAMTIFTITMLKDYKRKPFQLILWMSALAGLAVLDVAGYAVFLASSVPYLVNLVNFVPVAGTVAASLFAQRFLARLETGGNE